jgi:glucose/arabinose dehydrogenase
MRSRILVLASSLALAAFLPAARGAEGIVPTERGAVRLVTVARGLEHPWGMAFLPDGRLLVTERAGLLRIVAQDGTLGPPLSGVPSVDAVGQGGLLDVALDPDFGGNSPEMVSPTSRSSSASTRRCRAGITSARGWCSRGMAACS